MKKYVRTIVLAIILALTSTGIALAAYAADIVVVETSGNAYPMLAANATSNVRFMADNDFLGDITGLDTRILQGLTQRKHMLADDRIMFAVPVSAFSSQTLSFTTDSANLTHFPVIVGYSANSSVGLVTVSDAPNLEPAGNFTIAQEGWVDTSYSSNKTLVYKHDTFYTYISGSENITSDIVVTANVTLNPDADGDYTNITNLVGAPTHWQAVSDVNEAGSYVDNPNVAQEKDAYTLVDITASANLSSVESVTVFFSYRVAGAGLVHAQPFLRLGGVETNGTEVSTTSATYVTVSETLARPGGGNWSVVDINNLQVAMGIRRITPGEQCRLTKVWVVLTGRLPISNASNISVTAADVSTGEHTINTTVGHTPAVRFPKVNNAAITVGNPAELQFTGAFTIEANVYVKSTCDDYASIIDKGAGGGAGVPAYGIMIWPTGQARFWVYENLVAYYDVISQTNIRDDTWHHIEAILDGAGNLEIIIDGVSENTTAGATVSNGSSIINIGRAQLYLTTRHYDGYIDFVKISDPSGIVGLWAMDENIGVTVYDTSGNGNNGAFNLCTWFPNGGSSLELILDDVIVDATMSANITDNAFDWAFMGGNSLVYTDNQTITINNTAELWFRPMDILVSINSTSATLPDRTNAYNHGIITWGGNPSGANVTLGALISDYGVPSVDPLATPDIVPVVTSPVVTSDAAKTALLATDPLYETTEIIEDITGLPILLQYWQFYIVLAIVAFIVTYKYIPNLLLCGAIFCAVIGIATAIGIFDWWVIAVLVLFLAGMAVLEGRRVA